MGKHCFPNASSVVVCDSPDPHVFPSPTQPPSPSNTPTHIQALDRKFHVQTTPLPRRNRLGVVRRYSAQGISFEDFWQLTVISIMGALRPARSPGRLAPLGSEPEPSAARGTDLHTLS